MSSVSGWILSVTTAAILAAVVKHIAGSGTMAALVQYLAGIFLALTVVSPMLRLELPDMAQWLEDFKIEGRIAAAEGERMTKEKTQQLIKEKTEAYIWDKASCYGCRVEAEVELDESGIPISVTLCGDAAPAVRAKLEQMMETDLGIRKEAQHWIE